MAKAEASVSANMKSFARATRANLCNQKTKPNPNQTTSKFCAQPPDIRNYYTQRRQQCKMNKSMKHLKSITLTSSLYRISFVQPKL